MRFPIVQYRKVWYSISAILMIASITSVFTLGLNLSLDFTGGIQNSYEFTGERPSIDELKTFVSETAVDFNETAVTPIDIGTPVVVESGEEAMNVRFRIPAGTSDEGQQAYTDFSDVLSAEIGSEYQAMEEASFTISPSVGDVLKENSLKATGLAIIGIVLYIIFAFRKLPKKYNPLVFGLNTIIALIHDVVILLGIFVLLGYTMNVEIGTFFITAILTILGYSVNDTIVVMDRVRENMITQKGHQKIEKAAEDSVWQTMARSLNTSITVLLTLGALLILGAESTQMFVLALFLGVIVGTYSSVFIATPMLVTFQKWLMK